MIESFKNPRTRKEELIASGVVKGIYFNPLKEVVNRGGGGRDWFPTHGVTIIVDDDKISLGLTDKEVVRAKDVDGNYQDLTVGSEVTVDVTEGEEYNGKMQYRGFPSGITIVELAQATTVPTGGHQKPYTATKRDNSGVVAGNGFNAAKAFLGDEALDNPEGFIDTSKRIIDIGYDVRKYVSDRDDSLNEYAIGARAGMALITACESVESLDDVYDYAIFILESVLPEIDSYAKEREGGTKEKKNPPKAAKKVAKKATKKATKSVKQMDDVPQDDLEQEFDDDFDDDSVPF